MSTSSQPPVILFDGVCSFCNASINFILDRDPKGVFRFASLQGEAGKTLLGQHGLPLDMLSTLVLVEDGKAYLRSEAALRISRHMGFPWFLAGVFLLVPRFIRDGAYNLVANNRYLIMGHAAACRIPSPELKARFLDG